MLAIIVPFLLLVIFIILLRKKKKKRNVVFVGPRGTGKTRSLFKICRDLDVKTVPTIRDYSLEYKNIKIYEKTPKPFKDLRLRYNIEDKQFRYFFFINSVDDIHKFNGFDVKFVYFGKKEDFLEQEATKHVVFIDNNPKKLEKFI